MQTRLTRRTGTFLLLILTSLCGCATAKISAPPEPASAIAAFVAAMENADENAMAEVFDADATVFMPFEEFPARLHGRDEVRRVFGGFFEDIRKRGGGPPYMKITGRDLHTRRMGDTAVVTFHLGKLPDAAATEPVSFSRRTFVVHLTNGRWLITHLHASNMRLEAGTK